MTSKDVRQPDRVDRGTVLRFLIALPVYFLVFMCLPAGSWTWTRGWLFVGVFVGCLVASVAYLRRVNPEVIVARTHDYAGTKSWDKVLVWLLLPAIYAIVPVAALDDGRFHASNLPWWVCGVGYGLFAAAFVFVTWAQGVNKFFERTVRIQTDRGQTVVDRGPYALIRHPGYASAIPLMMGTALALGSLWALVPAVLASLLLVLRTRWEDETLQAELPGYKEYTQRVRYRLVPGVW